MAQIVLSLSELQVSCGEDRFSAMVVVLLADWAPARLCARSSVVQLRGVAMIEGNLYCKNCFMKLFKARGKYNDILVGSAPPRILAL